MQPKISLITPTRNRVDLLLRTINNVQQQTLQDWEMLVIDDGDGSGLEAVQNLTDPRVKAYPNAGTGQVDARNTAVQLAQAEVLHLLDDDDRWLDGQHFEKVLARLGTQPALLHRTGWLVLEAAQNGVWLEQHSRWVSVCVAHNSSTCWVWCSRMNICQLEGFGVDPSAMSVSRANKHGLVRRNSI